MKTLKRIAAVAILAVAANAEGVVIKGSVSLHAWPTGTEIVEEYAKSDVRNIERAAMQIRMRQNKQGIRIISIPVGATVEIQTLPDLKVVGRGKVNEVGKFTIEAPPKDSEWRAYCKIEREEFGKTVLYVGSSRTYKKRDVPYYEANIILKRTYALVEGRCLNKDGTPAKDIYVLIYPITQNETESENDRLWSTRVAVTDATGRWRADGIDSPAIDCLIPYICDTSLWRNVDFLQCPMALGIEVWRAVPYRRVAESGVANITDENHRAAEKAIAIYESRSGRKYNRLNPMKDFPVSTNNVIYVPDIVLP